MATIKRISLLSSKLKSFNVNTHLLLPNGFLWYHHPRSATLILLLRAAIKAAVSSDTEGKDSLRSESSIYSLPGVASAACIRKLYEVLDFSMGEHSGTCLALEWLDTTLAEVRYQPGAITYAIIQSLLRSALSSCTVLENNKVVNTGKRYSSQHVEIGSSAQISNPQIFSFLASERAESLLKWVI